MTTYDALYVNDAQLIKRLNLPKNFDPATFQFLQDKSGFPKAEAEFDNKRYFPAVIAWLDHRFGLGDRRPYFIKDDLEAWRKYPSKKKKRKTVWGE
ncbi:winged helix-turn-helix domain-containing protein [Agrobacterium pusense]|uniref:winged helix-turn-helix domain-containing protein n=1 Tax=Agrobacterium pusense TaxID=648995 RepID=UPI0028ADD861|nr:winged helix-turn-helix domain-containing protein [Agrobacterium pusense]